ncbi:hypothetical protein BDB01DRAFT_899622 [Pilobolus umbonatus]|nr:hypothetical protein BDB01DRAFT_899622 [Pilobolus umbonatus]
MLHFIPLLLATFVLEAQAFCIFNMLKDKKPFRAIQIEDRISSSRRFNNLVNAGLMLYCCDPSEPTCVVEQKEGVPVYFEIQFWWRHNTDNKRKVECISGGDLFIKGSETDYWAECVYNGTRTRAPLEPL